MPTSLLIELSQVWCHRLWQAAEESGAGGKLAVVWSPVFCVLSFIVTAICLVKLYCYVEERIWYLPQVPILRGIPFLGLTKLLLLDQECKSHEEVLRIVRDYGPICQFYLLGQHVVLINDGYVAKFVMEHVTGKGLFHQISGSTLSTFSLDTNNIWKKRRRTFRHAFTSSSLKASEEKMQRLVDRLCQVINENHLSTEENKKVLKIDALFGTFAVDIIYNIGFDLDRDFLHNHALYQKMNDAIISMFESSRVANMPIFKILLRNNIPFFYVSKYRKAMATVREFTTDILQEIRRKYQEKTLNELCFAKMLLDLALEEGLTEEEILSEILLFMVAGHETTAHSLAWIIYAMVKDVSLQEKCHDEMIRAQQQPHLETKPHATDEVITENTTTKLSTLRKRGKKAKDHKEKEKDTLPSEDHTHVSPTSMNLLPPYLEAVVKESMRKFPAASRGSMRLVKCEESEGLRISLESVQHNPYVKYPYPPEIHVPKGSWMMLNIFALHNWEGNWGDDVNEFKPERFLPNVTSTTTDGVNHDRTSSSEHKKSSLMSSPAAYHGGGVEAHQLVFAPFSYGARNCLGMNIALWEIRSVIGKLIQDYRFELAEEDLKDEHVALKTDITLKPMHQLPVYVYSRC